MKKFVFSLSLIAAFSLQAGPTSFILIVTQVPIPGDFKSIASTFGNHQATLDSCGRGGDLYVRYPDGTIRNLTRHAGFGKWRSQFTNGIVVCRRNDCAGNGGFPQWFAKRKRDRSPYTHHERLTSTVSHSECDPPRTSGFVRRSWTATT